MSDPAAVCGCEWGTKLELQVQFLDLQLALRERDYEAALEERDQALDRLAELELALLEYRRNAARRLP